MSSTDKDVAALQQQTHYLRSQIRKSTRQVKDMSRISAFLLPEQLEQLSRLVEFIQETEAELLALRRQIWQIKIYGKVR